MSASTDLRSYRDLVYAAMARAQATGAPEVFENEGPLHARIVVDVMMENAKTSLDVLAGSMSDDVWSRQSVEAFLCRNPSARLRVILDETDLEHSTAACLADHAQVEVKTLPAKLDMHLCVADRAHVRLEYDKRSREASVTFGDKGNFGARATEFFERTWMAARPIEVTYGQAELAV